MAKRKKTLAPEWYMVATSDSGDEYAPAATWDHEPTKAEVDAVRLELDSIRLSPGEADRLFDEQDGDRVVYRRGHAYETFINDYKVIGPKAD